MRTNTLITLTWLLLVTHTVVGQILYEPGYVIGEDGQRLEGLIQHRDELRNPSDIRFKETDQSKPRTIEIDAVKAFGIGSNVRFLKAVVEIDRSTHKQHMLNQNPNPEWQEDTVLLQFLIEGDVSLFYFQDRKNTAMFVRQGDAEIKQLIYKPYRDTEDQLRYNTFYRNQLGFLLDCAEMEGKPLDQLRYSKSEMIAYFKAYYACTGSSFQDYTLKPKRDAFNLYITGGYRNASFQSVPFYFRPLQLQKLDFGQDQGLTFGLDFEYILPFNRNRWALFVAPMYHRFSGTAEFDGDVLSADYRALELPLGLRRYYFIHPDHKISLALAYQIAFDAGSKGVDFPSFNQRGLSLGSNGNQWVIGVGYRYKHILSLEGRLQSYRNTQLDYWNWNIRYRAHAEIVLGVGLF